MKKKLRRIAFTEYDVAHLYELSHTHFSIADGSATCGCCNRLKRRLEKFIGPAETKYIQRETPKKYCPRP
jgi:hypothetical protein